MVSGSSLSTEQRLVTHVVRKPKLMKQLREALRSRHYSLRTEQIYCHWVKRFIYSVFPQENRWVNRKTREEGRHHVDESIIQKAVKGLWLYDQADTTRVTLSVAEYGTPTLGLYDKSGKTRVAFKVLKDGTPDLALRDQAGRIIWEAP